MKPKKLTTRQINALETKEAIYKAAINLFNKKGYENVHIEDITKAASTAKGTFYNYFKSKKDLLYHTFDKFDEMYSNAYETVKAIPTFEYRFLSFIEQAYKQIDNFGKKIPKALYYNNILEKDPQILRNDRVLYILITEMIEFGINTGELNSNKPVEYYLEMIKTQIVGIDYRWCVSSKELDLSQYAKENMFIFINGLMNI